MWRNVKLWISASRRWVRSKGFGIHSPFAYEFVREVLRQRLPYYGYSVINSAEAAGSDIRAKDARLLYRIAVRFAPLNVLVVGSRGPRLPLAILLSDSRNRLTIQSAGAQLRSSDSLTTDMLSRAECYNSVGDALRAFNQKSGDDKRRLIVVSRINNEVDMQAVETVAEAALADGGVVVVRSLMRCKECATLTSQLERAMERGMTFTNGRTAVMVGMRHLPKQRYNLWF